MLEQRTRLSFRHDGPDLTPRFVAQWLRGVAEAQTLRADSYLLGGAIDQSLPFRIKAHVMDDISRNSTEEYDQRVLVVVMNNTRDMIMVREQGWYRIPVKRAPAQIAADLMAFYQTGAFGEEKWAIRYYAPVRGYRLATRRQLLPDEPEHPRAQDLYYRVELGPLQTLPHPIVSAHLRRITFIPTTLQRLLQAREIDRPATTHL